MPAAEHGRSLHCLHFISRGLLSCAEIPACFVRAPHLQRFPMTAPHKEKCQLADCLAKHTYQILLPHYLTLSMQSHSQPVHNFCCQNGSLISFSDHDGSLLPRYPTGPNTGDSFLTWFWKVLRIQ